ncbi:hypothetical protein CKA32_002639 [Geitlerinema sp. FC II]|nr:hypothetical protein CKA32_002639 [Geitlerinema sp. FC II]
MFSLPKAIPRRSLKLPGERQNRDRAPSTTTSILSTVRRG